MAARLLSAALPTEAALDLVAEVDALPAGKIWDALREAHARGNRERWRIALLLLRVDAEQLYKREGHPSLTGYAAAALGMAQSSVSTYATAAKFYRAHPERRETLLQWSPGTVWRHIQPDERQPRRREIPGRSTALRAARLAPVEDALVLQGRRWNARQRVKQLVDLVTWLERETFPVDEATRFWLLRLQARIPVVLAQGNRSPTEPRRQKGSLR